MNAKTQAKHTPGPWYYALDSVSGWYVHVGYGQSPICSTKTEANARLIAAAPELLEVAKELLPWVESSPGFSGRENAPLLKKVRAIIAKAEGRE